MAKMTAVDVDLSLNNPALAPLLTLTRSDKYLSVPNKALPPVLTEQLKAIYEAIGGTWDGEESTILLTFQDGQVKRLYGPAVYADEKSEQLLIRWGNKFFALVIEDGKLVSLGSSVKFSPVTMKVGQFDEDVLLASLAVGKELLKFPIALKAADWKNPEPIESVQMMVEDGDMEGLQEVLAKINVEEALSGSFSDSPVTVFKELPIGDYQMNEYRSVKTKSGRTTYIISLTNPEGEAVDIWATAKLSTLINAGMVVEGATLSVPSGHVDCEFSETAEVVSLDFLS